MEQKVPTLAEPSWAESLDLKHLSTSDQEKITTMLSKYSSMWTGRLGEISIAKHRIDLLPDAKTIYQAPYRAGTKGREVEKVEVERMVKEGVIEPANSE
jgi:hypothetical protein